MYYLYSSMSTDNPSDIQNLVKNLTTHVETRLEYAKLVLVEKSAIIFSRVISFGIIAALGFIFTLMFSIAAAVWLGDALGSMDKGFLLDSCIYFFILLILLAFRKRFGVKKRLARVITLSL